MKVEEIIFVALVLSTILAIIYTSAGSVDSNKIEVALPDVPKLPVLVKLNVFNSYGEKIPFKVAVLDYYDERLVELTNESEILLENGRNYKLVIYSDGYWLVDTLLYLFLDFDCDCMDSENNTLMFYKIISVELDPIIQPYVVYYNNQTCVVNPNHKELKATATVIYKNGYNLTKTIILFDKDIYCMDYVNDIENITVAFPDYRLLNQIEFDRVL